MNVLTFAALAFLAVRLVLAVRSARSRDGHEEQQREHGAPRQLIGAVMDDKGVLRHGQRVQCASGEGEVLSGTFSPTLGKAIAMIRVPAGSVDGLQVDIRGRWVALRTVALPFVREGKIADGVLDPTPAR